MTLIRFFFFSNKARSSFLGGDRIGSTVSVLAVSWVAIASAQP
jgi:hypothetical protein